MSEGLSHNFWCQSRRTCSTINYVPTITTDSRTISVLTFPKNYIKKCSLERLPFQTEHLGNGAPYLLFLLMYITAQLCQVTIHLLLQGGGYYYSTRKNMEHPTPKYSGSNCICTHKLFYEIVGRNVKKYTSVINSFSYDFVIGASCPLVVQNI